MFDAGDDDECTSLHQARKRGQQEVARLLLDNRARVNARDCLGSTLLYLAARYGHEVVMQISYRANYDYEAVVQLLLDKGVNIQARVHFEWTALH